MTTSIKIVSWNIQSFGPLKSGLDARKNIDLIDPIAKSIYLTGGDIICIQEIYTSSDAKAALICRRLLEALNRTALDISGKSEFTTCVLSVRADTEYYAYFVRDTSVVAPLKISGAPGHSGVPKVIGGTDGVAVVDAEFSQADPGVNLNAAPLFLPDLKTRENARYPAPFGGARAPALALFAVPGAAACNRILPVMACHLSPQPGSADSEIHALTYYSLLQSLSHRTPASTLQMRADTDGAGMKQYAVNLSVILGDFNVDLITAPKTYAPLTDSTAPNLGATLVSARPTMMITFDDYAQSTITTTEQMTHSAFDNVALQVYPASPTPATATFDTVFDLPKAIMQGKVHVGQSVAAYADLGMRGFSASDDQPFVKAFADQLNGASSDAVSLQAAFTGSRMISDHEAVVVNLTL